MYLSLWVFLWLAGASTKTSDRGRRGGGGGNDNKEQRTLQLPCQETTPQFVSRRSPQIRTSRRRNQKRLHGKIKAGITRLRAEMAEISEEQKCIKEGQRQVRKKYEEIEAERKQLWKETELIATQSAGIQLKLDIMFKLVKARAQNDTALVAELTHSLRDLVAKQNFQIQ
ncbi:uncharacterized protein LOC119987870 isoform X2 [Tripterygium wilfordii]|uniref:uncharacterized protein LOC119987870 isoform X2 n=1 Tax=Tripterygium wilfordii TaxID=458696 RepID=UPI0018F802A5|nr:uncharacterized protein LOC119987870 isoform X2 [Tripterygium wilfordii]